MSVRDTSAGKTSPPSRCRAAYFLPLALLLAACATSPDQGDRLADPLRDRLLAREDIAMQNLIIARSPYFAYASDDEPYFGNPVEPPLPDLNLLPEDLPPWEDFLDTP